MTPLVEARGMHKLRGLRRRQAWTQEDLSMHSGVGIATIRRLEGGDLREPRPSTLRKLADALGVRPAVLVDCGPPERAAAPAAEGA